MMKTKKEWFSILLCIDSVDVLSRPGKFKRVHKDFVSANLEAQKVLGFPSLKGKRCFALVQSSPTRDLARKNSWVNYFDNIQSMVLSKAFSKPYEIS